MYNLQSIFNHGQFGSVRVILFDGEPWFIAKDLCDALDIAKHRDAISRLEPIDSRPVVVDGNRGARKMTAVSETGMYELVFMSRKEEAKAFRRWITSEVLPQLRKLGTYSVAESAHRRSIDMIDRWLQEYDQVWLPRLLRLKGVNPNDPRN